MKLPARARIVTFEAVDGVGRLELKSGEMLRFGATACVGFIPTVGLECWLIETKPDPLGGARAKTLNLTGRKIADRLTQAEDANRRAEAWRHEEKTLLASVGVKDERELSYGALASTSVARRSEIAGLLMSWRRQGHVFHRMWTILVGVSPESFHPFLSELDPSREPDSLAFVGASFAAVAHWASLLEASSESPGLLPLTVGSVKPLMEDHRDASAAANDAGRAVLAVARSSAVEARSILVAWLRRAPEHAVEEAAALLFDAGFDITADRAVVPLYEEAAYIVCPNRNPKEYHGILWGHAKSRCQCGAHLMSVIRMPSGAISSLALSRLLDPLEVYTCRDCVSTGHPYFVRLGPRPEAIVGVDGPAIDPIRHARVSPRPVAVSAELAPTRIHVLVADQHTRIGGAPSWVQGAEKMLCPECDSMMRFVAQFDDPPDDEWSADSGMLYAFMCAPCKIIGTITQCH